jgi:hypothetical protein
MEVLERLGGNVKDERNGACARIVRAGGATLKTTAQVHTALKGMESEGWVILDTVPTDRGPRGGNRIVEVQLMVIPAHFLGPIAVLRRERGIKWFDPEFVQEQVDRRVQATLREIEVSENGASESERVITPEADVAAVAAADIAFVASVSEAANSYLTEQNARLERDNYDLRIEVDALKALIRELRSGSRL